MARPDSPYRHRANFTHSRLAARVPLDLGADVDVQRYRTEKAKREDRRRPELEAARLEYLQLMADQQADKRGGRPNVKIKKVTT